MLDVRSLLTKVLKRLVEFKDWAFPKIHTDYTAVSIPIQDFSTLDTPVPSEHYWNYVQFVDTERWLARFQCQHYKDASGTRQAGAIGGMVGAKHPVPNIENYLIVGVNPDGTHFYQVTDPTAFCNAIGLGYQSNTYTTSYGNISLYKRSGVVTITFSQIKNMSANTFYTMTTLPAVYRPPAQTVFILRHPQDTYRLRVTIETNGQVRIYSYGVAIPNATTNNIMQTNSYVVTS